MASIAKAITPLVDIVSSPKRLQASLASITTSISSIRQREPKPARVSYSGPPAIVPVNLPRGILTTRPHPIKQCGQ